MEDKQNNKPRRSGGLKIKFLMLLFLLVSLAVCVICLLFLWYGGYAKEFTCKAVKQDSVIWNKLNCSVTTQPNSQNQNTTEQLNNQNSSNTSGNSEEQGLVETVVAKTLPSVVGIGVVGDGVTTEDQVIGTGFIISKDGLIVTNRHVVEDETVSYFIMFKDSTKSVPITKTNIFRDPVNDVALIKLESDKLPANIVAISLGDSDKIKLGQTVIAIGNPLGKYTGTITKGIISGLNRDVNISQGFFSSQTQVYSDVIQTDAAINPGNSGGPLIDISGQAVGINFATVQGASNLSFALPINRIKQRITELEQNGKFTIPFLGIEYQTKVVFIKGQSMIGAEITNIVSNSPASNSQLQKGDIIVEFNGQDLNTQTLSTLIQGAKIGSKVDVTILRNKVTQQIQVEIGQK